MSKKANTGDIEKITGLEFVSARKVDKIILSGKILSAATIVTLYQVLHYHMTDPRNS
jgi:hypothetical protein